MRKRTMQELNRISVEDFKQMPKTPLVLILDNIRSGLNVGSAFRTADAFGLEEIALCGITSTPPHKEILKTAIGATASVDWKQFATTVEAIEYYKNKGYKILAVEQVENSKSLDSFEIEPKTPYCVIFGNEVAGVSDEALAFVDDCIEIPQVGTKHSLNISVCVGIISWTFFNRQRTHAN